jgi:hypothetical protein
LVLTNDFRGVIIEQTTNFIFSFLTAKPFWNQAYRIPG